MRVICIRTCTVPKKGLVEKGQAIDVPTFDLKEFPFLKHFAAPAVKPEPVAEDVKKKPGKAKSEPDPLG